MLWRGLIGTVCVCSALASDVAVSTALALPPVIGKWTDSINRVGTNLGVLDTDATVADPDSVNFNTGTLTARFVAVAASGAIPASTVNVSDWLTIQNQGTGTGQIAVVGTDVKFSNVSIATMSHTQIAGVTVLTVTLKTTATPAAVQAMIRRIAYRNSSATTLGRRTVRIQVSDGTTGGASVAVDKAINIVQQSPLIQKNSDTTVRAWNSSVFLVDSDCTVTDPDSADFNTGTLKVTLPSTATVTDQMTLLTEGTGAGQINFVGTGVFSGSTPVGTWNGATVTGTGVLQVTFNSNATPAVVQAVLRRLAYRNAGSTAPATTTDRLMKIVLTDGDGGTTTVNKTIRLGKFDGTYTGTMLGSALPSGSTAAQFVANSIGGVTITLSGVSGTGTGSVNTGGGFTGSSSATIGGSAVTINFSGTLVLKADGKASGSGTWSFVLSGTTYTGTWTVNRP